MTESKFQETIDITPEDETVESKLERMIAGMQPDWKVQILRKEPRECSGFLEDYEVPSDSSESILSYISRTWGGRKFTLKFKNAKGIYKASVEVDLSSYPPKFWGKPIKPNFQGHFVNEPTPEIPPAIPSQPQIVSQAQNQYQPQTDPNPFANVLEILAKTRREDLALLQGLTQHHPTQPPQIQNGLSSLLETVQVFKQLQETLGVTNQQVDNSPNMDMQLFGMIGDVVKTLAAPKQQQIVPTIVQRSRPRNQQIRRTAPVVMDTPQPIRNSEKQDISQELAKMDPKYAADVCFSALGKMSENDRNKAMEHFLSCLSNLPEVDSNIHGEDSDYDEYDDNETDSDDEQDQNTR